MAPLQRLMVKPIEDPAEQAALDKRLRRSEKAIADNLAPQSRGPGATGEGRDSPS
jgi:hypothetical protein